MYVVVISEVCISKIIFKVTEIFILLSRAAILSNAFHIMRKSRGNRLWKSPFAVWKVVFQNWQLENGSAPRTSFLKSNWKFPRSHASSSSKATSIILLSMTVIWLNFTVLGIIRFFCYTFNKNPISWFIKVVKRLKKFNDFFLS